MSTLVDKQIVEEGPRNAVVKLTGVLSDSNITETSVIKPSDFTNNDRWQVISGFRVDAIMYSIGQGLEIVLSWNGNSPQQIAPIAGRGKIDATGDGGFLPNTLLTGYDGSINLATSGYSAGTTQNFTIFLRLVKLYAPTGR